MSHNPFPIPERYLAPDAIACRLEYPDVLRDFVERHDGKSGAIIVGPTGVRKSLAAAHVADRLRLSTSDTWVKWVRADKLSRILSERGGSEQIALLEQARFLVIDELGYERFPELVLEVIGDRHDHDRPTLVTSGVTLEQIASRYADATIRRITEVGNGGVVDCWGSP
jgi:DNA replication protein DnaC